MTIPDSVALLLPGGFGAESVFDAAKYDLDFEQRYRVGWLVLLEDRIVRIDGETPGSKTVSFLLSDIDEVRSESPAGSGLIALRVGPEYTILCRYSLSENRRMAAFARRAEKRRLGEESGTIESPESEPAVLCPTCGLRYPDPDRPVCPKCLDKRSVFARLLSFFRPHALLVVVIVAAMILQAAAELFGPYLNGRIFFDDVLDPAGRYHGRIVSVLLLMLGVRLFAVGVSVLYGRMLASVGARVIFALKTELFTALQKLSIGVFGLVAGSLRSPTIL